jgi:hypothetical protein
VWSGNHYEKENLVKKATIPTSYRFSEEAREDLKFLSKDFRLSQTSVLEQLIREAAELRRRRKAETFS